MSHRPVVTRFAPSPTGYLTAGNARTALFAWAYARQHAGRLVLRFEDTDQARSTLQSARNIIADLRWLGLDWDEGPAIPAKWDDALTSDYNPKDDQQGEHGPYFQSQRLDLYRSYVQRLLDSGQAYKCFKTAKQLDTERQKARTEKRNYRYDPTESMDLSRAQIADFEAAGCPFVVRLHVPDLDITFHDEVRGSVTVRHDELEDFIIQKADGFPTFHLAVTLDDALMGITHVLRAQDHLTNTAKHWALQDALGLDHPMYAHMPLIFNPDGSKMSKRDKAKVARKAAHNHLRQIDDPGIWFEQLARNNPGPPPSAEAPPRSISTDDINRFMDKQSDDALVVERIAYDLNIQLPEIDVADFRANGYLVHAFDNYLALLGWSPGEDVERFGPDPLGFIKDRFTLNRIVKSNAKFDREKLFRFNAEAIAELPPAQFQHQLYEHSNVLGRTFASANDPRFTRFAHAYHHRARTLSEPERIGRFFLASDTDIDYDPKAVRKVLTGQGGKGRTVLHDLRVLLADLAPWETDVISQALAKFTQQQQLSMKNVAQPLRVAVSGGTVSPPIDQTLAILGKPSTLARIERCLSNVEPHTCQ